MPTIEKILCRVYRSKDEFAASGNMAVIVWPLEPSDYQPGIVTAWARIGQHCGIDLPRCIQETRPATPEEAAEAIAQWRYEGPDRTEADVAFRILKRSPSWSAIIAAHRKVLSKIAA